MDNLERRKKRIHSINSPLPSKRTVTFILIGISISLVLLLNYWVINTLFIKDVQTSIVKCGVVNRIFERYDYNIKTGELENVSKIIIMKYDDGEYSEKNVSNSTYYSVFNGSRLCFSESLDSNNLEVAFAIVVGFILCIIYIILIIAFFEDILDVIFMPFEWLWSKLPD